MFERVKAIFDKWHMMKEMASLSDAELADLGLSRGQLDFLMRMPTESVERMAKMAAVFGISPAELQKDHLNYVELLEVCGHCGARKACGKFLAQGAAANAAKADFCPNAETYNLMNATAA